MEILHNRRIGCTKWGEMRATGDADFTLLVGWGNEANYLDPLFISFAPRYPDAKAFALKARVALLTASNGIPIDVALGAFPFEAQMIKRSKSAELAEGFFLPVCSAEDLIVSKAFASRPQDWQDIRGIVARQEKLNTSYIMKHLKVLAELKETPEIVDQAEKLLGIRK